MLSSLQNPGLRLYSRFGGDGVGSFGAIKGAKTAKNTRKRMSISPNTAALL
jgi:hypothetical protein